MTRFFWNYRAWEAFFVLLVLVSRINQNLISNSGFRFWRYFREKMFGCDCYYWKETPNFLPSKLEAYSLPAPLPQWPQGQGFGSGKINLGEIEVIKITRFEYIWDCSSQDNSKGVTFYKPVGIPDGYWCLGHYCQPNSKPLQGFVLAARNTASSKPEALRKPLDYTLIWCPDDGIVENYGNCGYFWLPLAPEGFKPVGYLVTNKPAKPDLDDVRCVRADLTDSCETYRLLLEANSKFTGLPFQVWTTRPCSRGMMATSVSAGTFFCSTCWEPGEDLHIACLRNLDPTRHAMPNLNQIHELINHYGPTVYFHPDEVYFPSSVSWFFESGALLHKQGDLVGEPIDADGSNLPAGGTNDRRFWIDLPNDGRRESLKRGNLESAKLYIHVKPALGGTFTDIAMWIFSPFNGPATLKVGLMNIVLNKIGQHVGDWEHFTLRVCNFTGELFSIFFSQHSGGEWVNACDLEYILGNKAAIYSSKGGHASYPHPGTYIQGSAKLGIGPRNDVAPSKYYIDSSLRHEIVAAEYLGDGVVREPCWLQYMREWGPTVVYGSRSEMEKIVNRLPGRVRWPVQSVAGKFPGELYGEEGPTGPKEKNMWEGDERG